jgi:hypothetical protein
MDNYSEIGNHIRETHGFTVKPCWIAHVASDHGLTTRQAYNRIDPNVRSQPCPRAKRTVIEEAFRHFGMI